MRDAIIAVIAIMILLFTAGCAPLIIGSAAGLVVANHENHRNWCQYHYDNPHCWGKQVR